MMKSTVFMLTFAKLVCRKLLCQHAYVLSDIVIKGTGVSTIWTICIEFVRLLQHLLTVFNRMVVVHAIHVCKAQTLPFLTNC